MKRILIFSGCLLLILLITSMYNHSSSEESHNSSSLLLASDFSISSACFASSLVSDRSYKNKQLNIDRSYLSSDYRVSHWLNLSDFYIPQMLGWAVWIRLPRRSPQPYRNPQRRFRLNKKQRRRLRRRLSNLLLQESPHSTLSLLSSSLEWA